jgi:hypothetical protein
MLFAIFLTLFPHLRSNFEMFDSSHFRVLILYKLKGRSADDANHNRQEKQMANLGDASAVATVAK